MTDRDVPFKNEGSTERKTICNQDALIVPVFMRYGISVSLDICGNLVEMLFFGRAFLFVNNAAFPCSFWGCADTFIFISYLHDDLLFFDKISISENRRNIKKHGIAIK